jgi:hypothetical protein
MTDELKRVAKVKLRAQILDAWSLFLFAFVVFSG